MVQRLRAGRPDAAFTISLRTADDGQDAGALRGKLEAYKAAGVQHVLVAPEERGLEEYLAAVERVARCAEGMCTCRIAATAIPSRYAAGRASASHPRGMTTIRRPDP